MPLVQWLLTLLLGPESGLTSQVWYYLLPILSYTFGGLWILPLFCLSRVINVFWFQDVADSAFKGKFKAMDLPTLVADTVYSLVIEALFLLQVGLHFDPVSSRLSITHVFDDSYLNHLNRRPLSSICPFHTWGP